MITHPTLFVPVPLQDWSQVRDSLSINRQHPLAILYVEIISQLKALNTPSIEVLSKLQNFQPKSPKEEQAQRIFHTFMMNQFPQWASLWPESLCPQEKEWLLNTPNGCPFATLIRTICRRLDDFSLQDVLALLPPQNECNDPALLIEIAKMEHLFSEKQPDWLLDTQKILPRENLFYSLALATVRRDWPTVNILLENQTFPIQSLRALQQEIPDSLLPEALPFFSLKNRHLFFEGKPSAWIEYWKATSQSDPASLPKQGQWSGLDRFLTDCTSEDFLGSLAQTISKQSLFNCFEHLSLSNIEKIAKKLPSDAAQKYIAWAKNQTTDVRHLFGVLRFINFPQEILKSTLIKYKNKKTPITKQDQSILYQLYLLLDRKHPKALIQGPILIDAQMLFYLLAPNSPKAFRQVTAKWLVNCSINAKSPLIQTALAAPMPLLAYRLLYWASPQNKEILIPFLAKKFIFNQETLQEALERKPKDGLTNAEKENLLEWIQFRENINTNPNK